MSEVLRLRRFVIGGFAVTGSLIAAWLGQPLVHGNEQAVEVIVTVFSILAGFLVAIISLVGEGVELRGSWRLAEKSRALIKKRLIRHQLLFFGYLVTLALVFLSTLVAERLPQLTIWLERGYLWLATLAFVFSLWLPPALAKIQREKVDRVIEDKLASEKS